MAWYKCFRTSLGKFSHSFKPAKFSINSLHVIFLPIFWPCISVLSNIMAQVKVWTASKKNSFEISTIWMFVIYFFYLENWKNRDCSLNISWKNERVHAPSLESHRWERIVWGTFLKLYLGCLCGIRNISDILRLRLYWSRYLKKNNKNITK